MQTDCLALAEWTSRTPAARPIARSHQAPPTKPGHLTRPPTGIDLQHPQQEEKKQVRLSRLQVRLSRPHRHEAKLPRRRKPPPWSLKRQPNQRFLRRKLARKDSNRTPAMIDCRRRERFITPWYESLCPKPWNGGKAIRASPCFGAPCSQHTSALSSPRILRKASCACGGGCPRCQVTSDQLGATVRSQRGSAGRADFGGTGKSRKTRS